MSVDGDVARRVRRRRCRGGRRSTGSAGCRGHRRTARCRSSPRTSGPPTTAWMRPQHVGHLQVGAGQVGDLVQRLLQAFGFLQRFGARLRLRPRPGARRPAAAPSPASLARGLRQRFRHLRGDGGAHGRRRRPRQSASGAGRRRRPRRTQQLLGQLRQARGSAVGQRTAAAMPMCVAPAHQHLGTRRQGLPAARPPARRAAVSGSIRRHRHHRPLSLHLPLDVP